MSSSNEIVNTSVNKDILTKHLYLIDLYLCKVLMWCFCAIFIKFLKKCILNFVFNQLTSEHFHNWINFYVPCDRFTTKKLKNRHLHAAVPKSGLVAIGSSFCHYYYSLSLLYLSHFVILPVILTLTLTFTDRYICWMYCEEL